MKKIVSISLLCLLTLISAVSVQASIVLINQENQYISQTAGNATAVRIADLAPNEVYTITVYSSQAWTLTTSPTGQLTYIINGIPYPSGTVNGQAGASKIQITNSTGAIGKSTLTFAENGDQYRYEINYLAGTSSNGFFNCSPALSQVSLKQGESKKFTNGEFSIVSLGTSAISVTNGTVLGKSSDGKITVTYTGSNTTISSVGVTKLSEVTVTVDSSAKAGNYPITLDGIPGVDPSSCTMNVTVNVRDGFNLLCDEALNTINVLPNIHLDETASLAYTLSAGTYNVNRWSGPTVDGLHAEVPQQIITASSNGKIQVWIKGRPNRVGIIRVPVEINGVLCYIAVNVGGTGNGNGGNTGGGNGSMGLDCGSAAPVYGFNNRQLDGLTTVKYGVSTSLNIERWIGPSVKGVHAEIPQQIINSSSAGVQVYIKGQPDSVGTITVPIQINGVLCYVTVIIS